MKKVHFQNYTAYYIQHFDSMPVTTETNIALLELYPDNIISPIFYATLQSELIVQTSVLTLEKQRIICTLSHQPSH